MESDIAFNQKLIFDCLNDPFIFSVLLDVYWIL